MKIIRLPEVKNRTGLGKTTIYAMIASGNFPKPIKLSVRAVGWEAGDVDCWLQGRMEAAGTGLCH